MDTSNLPTPSFLTSARNTLLTMLGVLVVILVLSIHLILPKPEPAGLGCAVVDIARTPPYSESDVRGKDLFMMNCASCHNRNMRDNLTGPALGGVRARWAAYPKEDLYTWIRNSQAMIKTGHPRAVELWNKWKPNIMQSFGQLTDEDIEAILAYVEETGQY